MGFVRDCFDVESLGERRVPASVHNVEHRFARRAVGTENILSQRASGREEIVGIHDPIDESPVVCRLCVKKITGERKLFSAVNAHRPRQSL